MSAATCRELQRRWLREAARDPLIPLPFHMSDCVCGSKAFAHLRDDEPARLHMQERMIRTFTRLDMQAFGASVQRSEYSAIATELRPKSEWRDPWFLAFEAAIGEVMNASAERGKPHSVTLVFDRADEFSKRAFEMYEEILKSPVSYRDRLGSLTFSPKDKVAALQAVDVIVYEVNRFMQESYAGGAEERWQNRLIGELIYVNGPFLNEAGLQILNDEVHRSRENV
jgi:hypothetical protein